MTLIPPTRKRTRSCEEEDFLPLSKKINNLHINNWGNVDPAQEHILEWNNSSERLINFYTEGLSNGRHEDESTSTSCSYKSAQENIQNNYIKTDLIRECKEVNNESFKNSDYLPENNGNGESSSSSRGQNNWSPVYNPDLGVNENPYYYESNKLLFGLYIERLQRTGF
ncbi:conserved hypothetical protein [Pediculus humanus corporis]|uniref:Uncharacterized protein n=1 Tax=Pediculus humanus subsp. corporis TaxID=121224 RepID=E0VTC3_PEDHC|nr:uncharacterized protein Phum_PHUM430430 [Pediculus humanus corporis]EEB16629.1 conserved hypothetical protein [Pediculus humanus corporis]